MPYQVFWDNDAHTIVRHTLEGDWTLTDYWQGLEQAHALMHSVLTTVHVIVDLSLSQSYPTHLLSITRAVDASVPTNQGMLVGVKVSPYLVSLLQIAKKLAPNATRHLHFAANVEEAHAIIARHQDAF